MNHFNLIHISEINFLSKSRRASMGSIGLFGCIILLLMARLLISDLSLWSSGSITGQYLCYLCRTEAGYSPITSMPPPLPSSLHCIFTINISFIFDALIYLQLTAWLNNLLLSLQYCTYVRGPPFRMPLSRDLIANVMYLQFLF